MLFSLLLKVRFWVLISLVLKEFVKYVVDWEVVF